jgi:SAM-dependent methyltransferase
MMLSDTANFDRLVTEAEAQDFSGWDFSYLSGRCIENGPTWDYRQKVLEKLAGINTMLDMGTGGGEFLASLQPLPKHTYATEGYAPNIPIARARLEPLCVQVLDVLSDEDLPFEDDFFDLVLNRHESFSAQELWRILKPGGRFLTQQVGGKDCIRLNELLQENPMHPFPDWVPQKVIGRLQTRGFEISEQQEENPEMIFLDIGAVVYFLKAISWQIEGFSVAGYRERLLAVDKLIHEEGGLVVHSHRFYIEARKV